MIKAKCLAATKSSFEKRRLYTVQFTIPRVCLAEFVTHGLVRRNTSSSRAIPVATRIKNVMANPWIPHRVGVNKPGMQATEYLSPVEYEEFVRVWKNHVKEACSFGEDLSTIKKVHKEIANRVFENFSYVTLIATSAHWETFFRQRIHEAAQDPIAEAAIAIYEAIAAAEIEYYDIHIPFASKEWKQRFQGFYFGQELYRSDLVTLRKALEESEEVWNTISSSVGRAASVSYERQDEERTQEQLMNIFNKMYTSDPAHWSPFEHIYFASDLGPQDRTWNSRACHNFANTQWTSLRSVLENTSYTSDCWDKAVLLNDWSWCADRVREVKEKMNIHFTDYSRAVDEIRKTC